MINAISLSRILIISAVFPPEPVVSAILSKDIATSLSKDHSIVVLCPQPSRPEGYRFTPVEGDTGYEVIHLDSYTSAA